MSKKIARIAAFCAAVAVVGISLPGSHALAARSNAHRNTFVASYTRYNCWIIVARLNGSQPPTTTCLLARSPADGEIRPDIGSVACDNSERSPQLQLYADQNFSGSELCLFGQGATDLGTWSFDNVMTSWKDQASSVCISPGCV